MINIFRFVCFVFSHFATIFRESTQTRNRKWKSHQLVVVMLESHVCLINYHGMRNDFTCWRNFSNVLHNKTFCFRPTEVLQSSRCSRMEQSMGETEDSGIYQNMNETCKVRDVNDVLGPLPQIPTVFVDSDKNWSRRVSSMSGIYEEIIDPSNRCVTESMSFRVAFYLFFQF